MSIVVAIWIVRFVGLYLTLGALFALAFVTRGVGRIDPAARNASLGFRVLLLPGLASAGFGIEGCASIRSLVNSPRARGPKPRR